LERVEILTDQRPDPAVVDCSCRGHGVDKTRVLISGTRRGPSPKLIPDIRRRSAIEAEIDHMKTDGRLARCLLKGTFGAALPATLCACGHNIRKNPSTPQGLARALHRDHPERNDQPRSMPQGTRCSLKALFRANHVAVRLGAYEWLDQCIIATIEEAHDHTAQ
jgi:hypothetical protein